MTKATCKEIHPLLVDYADGALAAAEVDRVAGHLAECARCRKEVRLLERSLELVRKVWQEEAAVGESPIDEVLNAPCFELTSQPARHQAAGRGFRRKALWIGCGAAVCIALVLAVVGPMWFSEIEQPGETARSNGSKQAPSVPSPENMDIEAILAREDRSARLAMSVRMLAGQPGLEEYRASAERYLRENYAGTAAIRMLDGLEKSVYPN